jgi:hypothetical protein
MTKREVVDGYADALLAVIRDCEQNYPQDRLDWARDSKRVHQNVRSRGSKFVFFDLPVLGDWLLASLEDERLRSDARPPCGRRRSRSDLRPRMFWGLWSRVFDERGLLLLDPDPTAIFLLITLCNLWKKAEVPCSPIREVEAYREYFEIEDVLPPSSSFWDGDGDCPPEGVSLADFSTNLPLLGKDDRSTLLEDCQKVCDYLVAEFGLFEADTISGRHGPGAVSDLRRGAQKCDFPTWPERLDRLFPFDHHGVLNSLGVNEMVRSDMYPDTCEVSSYLTDVPKTQKAPRLIAEEPTCNQWIQQGISDLLRDRVRKSSLGVCIDFFDQVPSQDACRAASVTGLSATIDLSSASDRLSTAVCERVFRRNYSLLDMLRSSRTRFLRQDRYSELPKLVKLRKFASMGSALTFPVQSIVFASLAIGVGASLNRCLNVKSESFRAVVAQVRVFGDDIVLPSTWVVPLTQVLTCLGLKVNASKSYSRGNFRESCGLYAFRGYDVTPARIRHPFSASNGASRVSWWQGAANTFLKGLWRLSAYMEHTCTAGRRKAGSSYVQAPPIGLPTFSPGFDPAHKIAWDRNLQCDVVEYSIPERGRVSQEADDGVNGLLRLGRAVYKHRTTLADFMSLPQVLPEGWHELLGAVDGPAGFRRRRVPLHFAVVERT